MTFQIIHGGQTGVDRGAHRGAISNRLAVGGFAPADCRDERGLIPSDVLQHLAPLPFGGFRERTKENVQTAHALLVVVRDRTEPYATPGTKLTLQLARQVGLQSRFVADTETKPSELMAWARSLVVGYEARRQRFPQMRFCLMVAGPRASMWPEGERVTLSLLDVLGVAIGSPHA